MVYGNINPNCLINITCECCILKLFRTTNSITLFKIAYKNNFEQNNINAETDKSKNRNIELIQFNPCIIGYTHRHQREREHEIY